MIIIILGFSSGLKKPATAQPTLFNRLSIAYGWIFLASITYYYNNGLFDFQRVIVTRLPVLKALA
jgi:hypothetical protein